MSVIEASKLLRPGLLKGVSVLVAGAQASVEDDGGRSLGSAAGKVCAELGARVSNCAFSGELQADEPAIAATLDAVLADTPDVALLVVDAASLFGLVQQGPSARARAALAACLDLSWNVTRAVAERAFLRDERGGRIVLLAPPADAGEHARAALAGLENLARTLSIEWARHAITSVTIAPGSGAGTSGEVAALTAYLASPAAAYFSGCLLDLRGPSAGA